MSAILKLVQGTPDWHAHRRTTRNASESAAVLGISPFQSPYQLWLVKTGRSVTEVTPAMQHGTDLEPAARRAYEEHTGNLVQPLVVQDGDYSASLDGITIDEALVLEVKCPVRGRRSELWQDAAQGIVPEHYRVQVQHQLMVSGATTAHLWVFDGTDGVLVELTRDDLMMARIRQVWDGFQIYIDEDRPPPMVEGDVLLHDDAEWLAAAQAFVSAKQAAELADAALDDAKKALLALSKHPREEGGGVLVTHFVKQGNVDYKKVPALAGVDLEQYRGPQREEVRITIKPT